MNTKNITIGILVAVAVVFGVIAFKTPTVVTVPGESLGGAPSTIAIPPANVTVEAAKPIVIPAPVVNVNVPKQSPTLGAVSSPDIMSDYLCVAGLCTYSKRITMKTATTSLCAIQAPVSTSTLIYASWRISTGSSTASVIDIGTSTTPYATTTMLVKGTVMSANNQGYAYWIPHGSGVDNDTAKMAPSEWLNVMAGGAGTALGGYTYTGYCSAEFRVL